ncbi:MAG: hypothetical protein ACI4TC_07275, partial [Kiritimatiellia bacterium]
LYEGRTFLWTFIVGHLVRIGSRNAMDANRNDQKYADAILKLAVQGVWPEGERKTAPCTLSCCNFLSRGFPVQMINLLQHICMVSTSAIKHNRRFLFISISRSVAHKVSWCNSIGHP